MLNINKIGLLMLGGLLTVAMFSCKPNDPIPTEISEDTYAGGELGTTFNISATDAACGEETNDA